MKASLIPCEARVMLACAMIDTPPVCGTVVEHVAERCYECSLPAYIVRTELGTLVHCCESMLRRMC